MVTSELFESICLAVYDGWNLVEERIDFADGSSSTNCFYWGKDLSGSLQGAGGVGGLLYLTIDGAVYVPLYDANGNVTHYCDEDGTVVAQYTYDAFGRTISQSGPMADAFRHRFSTKYLDPEPGLYYYGYRFYHTVLKRWLNRDPIEEAGGMNLYCACNNSSMDHYDSHGQKHASQCVKYSVKSNKLSEKEITWVNFPTLQW